MNGYKNNLYCMKSKLNHSITDNSSVLVLFLKALKVRTVLLESGNECVWLRNNYVKTERLDWAHK